MILSRIHLVGCAKGKVQGAECIAQGSKLLCAERQEPCYDECSCIERTILRCVSGYMVPGARHGVSEGTMLAFFFASIVPERIRSGWVGGHRIIALYSYARSLCVPAHHYRALSAQR